MNYRNLIDEVCYKQKSLLKEQRNKNESLATHRNNLADHEKVRQIFQTAAIITQNALSEHIGYIVTRAITSVFPEKNVEFKVEFVERRNKTECDLYIVEEGEQYDLLDDRGHGMADIASCGLRISYISLDSVENVIIMDEPFRNLDKERQPLASKMIKELSKELDIQFIISTHIPDLINHADNHIKVNIKNGVSYAS